MFINLGKDACSLDGIPTQGQEIVFNSDLPGFQHLLPNVEQFSLERIPRCSRSRCFLLCKSLEFPFEFFSQPDSLDFASRSLWDFLNKNDSARDFETRQAFSCALPQVMD